MNWIVVLVIPAALIYCIFKLNWFRDCLLVIIILVTAVICLYHIFSPHRDWYAGSIIMVAPEEVELTKIKFPDPFAQSGSSTIEGRIKNNSERYTLSALCLNVQLIDNSNDRSEIIGSDEVYLSLKVPPQQIHVFKANPHFGTLNAPKGKYDWLCSIGPVQVVDSKYPTLMN